MMATGCGRSTRKLKQWIIEQVESDKYPGLTWDDPDHTSFRIPWKHAGKHDFREDEDAAIFKEWAIYKNKYKEGDKVDPAMWKTRLRCALNKSPEFENVPERSKMNVCEQYKVYRLVPPEEQTVKEVPSSRKRKTKRKTKMSRDVSSEEKMESRRPSTSNLISMEAVKEHDPNSGSYLHTDDSGIGSSSDSPQRSPDSMHKPTLDAAEAAVTSSVLEAGIYAMHVTIFYGGKEVLQKDVQSLDCQISSAPLAAAQPCSAVAAKWIEQIFLPSPDTITDPAKRCKTQDQLSFLGKGIMLASSPEGIYVQPYCQGWIFWTGPCVPLPGRIKKLKREAHVKVFDTKQFLGEIDLYKKGQGPAPKYQVILCFGEEISDTDQKEDQLITVQVEQKFAWQQMLQNLPESYTSTLALSTVSVS